MIQTIDLFPELDARLLDLLEALADDDWRRPTIAGRWVVRDVVAHLLDTALRRLTIARDGWPPDADIASDEDLVAFIDAVNADGVRVLGRLSPRLLRDLMAVATTQLHAHLAARDSEAPADFPVSWAGDASSAHWFDVAREYTERWHHQAQIRLAVDRLAPLLEPRLYAPVIATFMCAVPHACRVVEADAGTQAFVLVEGEGGGCWRLTREPTRWRLERLDVADVLPATPADGAPATIVRVPAALAWRLFTKGLDAGTVAATCRAEGDPRLAAAILGARAIVG